LAALPERTAFVDFAKVSGVDERGFSEDRYVALIYPQRGKTSFEIVELGLAKMIEDKISLFLALVESSHEDPKLETVARELSQLLVSPWIYKIDPQKEELILCPDGALTFLNFGALPDSGGKFLAEKIKVNYVSAARDIVSPVVLEKVFAGGSKPQVGIFVDPDFGAPPILKVKELIASRRSTELHRLPEARLESFAVKEAFQETSRKIDVFSDSEATESRLRSLAPYWVLHLGTHGFFNKYATKNPMKGAGLAMAGAYPNLKAGLNSEYDDNPDDGILTAEEISKLDLKSCVLVSVSACQSGMGQSLEGEGVLGLRRAFYRAGVMNVLLCLWPIGDKDARAFVENFYSLVKQDIPLKDVYPKTMAKMLREYADKKGITYAIRATGPFVMSCVWKKIPK
jgi:CHAT domain-containing protein